MKSVALGALGGASVILALPSLPGVWVAGLLPLLLWLVWRRPAWRFVGSAALGACWAMFWARAALSPALPAVLEGRDVVLEARIVGVPEQYPDKARFLARPITAPGARAELPERIRLSWYHNPRLPRSGERWRFTVRLKRPHGFANPGGFDYERWLFSQRIGATGYVRKGDEARLLASGGWSIDRFRQDLGERLDRLLPGSSASGLLKALILGIRSGLSHADWQTLTRAGVNHLVAISGLHIGLIAGLAFWVTRRLWSLSPRLCLWLPAQKAAAALSLPPAIGYAALAGFSVPTQRALLMLTIAMLSLLAWRAPRPFTVLAGTLLAVLALDPLAVLSPGFWLSFAAVATIVWLALVGMKRGVAGAIGIQWRLVLALAPLTFWWFGQGSLIAPLANLIAIPLVALIAVPLALLGVVLLLAISPLGAAVLQGVGNLLSAWLRGMSQLASWPLAWGTFSFPGALALVAALVSVGMMAAFRGLPGRWLGLVLPAAIVLASAEPMDDGEFRVAVLDVGQGLSSVVQTRRHVLVYDTGDRFSQRFNAADAVVSPFLVHNGIRSIDTLVLSHADRDHSGAARALLARFPARRVLASFTPSLPDDVAWRPCRTGEQWRWDGVSFRILSPDEGVAASDNDRSCVLLIDNGRGKMLLAGDIERRAERALVKRYGDILRGSVLLAPHHGSDTSSSAEFLDEVRPSLAIASLGYRNRYAFPDERVLERYRSRGIRLLRTDRDGAVIVRFGERSAPVAQTWRSARRRFWSASTSPPALSPDPPRAAPAPGTTAFLHR